MKKTLTAFALCGLLGGCMTANPANSPWAPGHVDKLTAHSAAETRIAEKLPVVSPESITAQNVDSRIRELEAEMDRARRVASTAGADSIR